MKRLIRAKSETKHKEEGIEAFPGRELILFCLFVISLTLSLLNQEHVKTIIVDGVFLFWLYISTTLGLFVFSQFLLYISSTVSISSNVFSTETFKLKPQQTLEH